MAGGVCAAQVSLLFKELSFDYECDVAVESLAAIKRAVERINQGVPAQLKAAVSVGNDMRHMYVDRDHGGRLLVCATVTVPMLMMAMTIGTRYVQAPIQQHGGPIG